MDRYNTVAKKNELKETDRHKEIKHEMQRTDTHRAVYIQTRQTIEEKTYKTDNRKMVDVLQRTEILCQRRAIHTYTVHSGVVRQKGRVPLALQAAYIIICFTEILQEPPE